MLKPHLSYIAAISVHRRTSGYPWRGGSVRSDFQCRLLYLKTYGGSREVAEDDRSLLNSWRWSLGRSKWGVKCSDPNSRISVFWTTLLYSTVQLYMLTMQNLGSSHLFIIHPGSLQNKVFAPKLYFTPINNNLLLIKRCSLWIIQFLEAYRAIKYESDTFTS